MKPLFADTPPQDGRVLVEGYRRMMPRQKLQRVAALNHALEQLAAARLRAHYGDGISKRELRLRLAALRLPREVMVRVFGWDQKGY